LFRKTMWDQIIFCLWTPTAREKNLNLVFTLWNISSLHAKHCNPVCHLWEQLSYLSRLHQLLANHVLWEELTTNIRHATARQIITGKIQPLHITNWPTSNMCTLISQYYIFSIVKMVFCIHYLHRLNRYLH
jgi:hypothetical protein